MMRILPTITVLAAVFGTLWAAHCPTPATAAEPAEKPPALDLEVRRLIGDLAGATRHQRTAAEQRLMELGPQVLRHLPAAELLPSNSVRETVRRIRLELERRQARDSILPSRVTLNGKRTLGESLAEITKQSGNVVDGRLLPAEMRERSIDLQAAEVPFWQLVDELSEKFQVRYEYDAELRGLKLLPAADGLPTTAVAKGYAGAFRIEVPLAARLRRAAAARAAANIFALPRDLLRITLRVRPEPRLRPLFLQFATREIVVRTADNRELAPFSPDASYELSLSEGASQSPIQMDYVVPDGVEVGLLSLKGKMRCTTAAGNETFRFTGLDKAGDFKTGVVSRRRGGVTVSLNRVVHEKRELRIQVVVAYETGGPAFESHRTWFLHNDVALVDQSGRQLPLNGGSETIQQGEGTLGIEYRFVELPEPLPDFSFVYVAPTLIVDVPIEFEIESVPVTARPAGTRSNK